MPYKCAVYGESAVAERIVRKWFKADDFNLKDHQRPGRPSTTDEDQIKTLIENNPRYTTPWLHKFDVWVPHDLTEKNLMDRISICDSLYKRNEKTFLKQVVTGDEKWIIYNNVERKKSWEKRNEPPLATPKTGLHPKKVMLCVWDWKGILGPSLKNPLQNPLQSLTLPLGPLLLAQDGLAEICEGCPRSEAHNRSDNGAVCPVKDIEPQPLKK
ncbi:PREDICTED: histone-lysine N-methyltransferase SETMAR-like [Acromyrmex echinatior]|uniref:histone-lysine N-methyltransferase SETMAR-like n=1 Tax=Acromyrmex echinatior TaxID=103372 RepID=UPI000580E810|nr:PREDICTED: histone-lysine N-methyltransferase SETMAR-like [Acromyrmex echinatior]